MTEGRGTWARSSYRNTTGGELRSVLILMGLGGRTVEVRCTVDAQDEPGTAKRLAARHTEAPTRTRQWLSTRARGGRGGSAPAEGRFQSGVPCGGLTPVRSCCAPGAVRSVDRAARRVRA